MLFAQCNIAFAASSVPVSYIILELCFDTNGACATINLTTHGNGDRIADMLVNGTFASGAPCRSALPCHKAPFSCKGRFHARGVITTYGYGTIQQHIPCAEAQIQPRHPVGPCRTQASYSTVYSRHAAWSLPLAHRTCGNQNILQVQSMVLITTKNLA